MLTGGSGDGNLEPRSADGEDLEEIVTRARTLLKFGVLTKGRQVDARGKARDNVIVERWKTIFQKYDSTGAGILTLNDVRRMVRGDLKIPDRLIPDRQLELIFSCMDEDGGGSIEFDEFMTFVQQTSHKNHISPEEVVKSVGRAVRLAMHRNKMHIHELESKFRSYDDLDPLTGELGPAEMRRFFRNVLKVSKHECSDRNLVVTFRSMDEDGSGSMSREEFMDFIKYCFEGCPRKDPPARLQGIIGGTRGMLPERMPRHRPGTDPTSTSGLPFCINGRDLPAVHRLGVGKWRWPPSPRKERWGCRSILSLSGGAITATRSTDSQSESGEGSEHSGEGSASQAETGSQAPISPMTGTLPSLVHGGPTLAHSTSLPAMPSPTREFQIPRKPQGGYKTFKGAEALNRIEQQLFEVGLDARGEYHRLR